MNFRRGKTTRNWLYLCSNVWASSRRSIESYFATITDGNIVCFYYNLILLCWITVLLINYIPILFCSVVLKWRTTSLFITADFYIRPFIATFVFINRLAEHFFVVRTYALKSKGFRIAIAVLVRCFYLQSRITCRSNLSKFPTAPSPSTFIHPPPLPTFIHPDKSGQPHDYIGKTFTHSQ